MNLDSQNWEQLQQLFHLVAAAPAEQRERLLAEACPDATLRHRVMEIFDASEEEPQVDAESNSQHGNSHDLNSRLGPYRLLRHLGTGGIGSVYLGERMMGGSPHRFAVKVLAQHAAGPQFVERFHREEHILGSLEHPNITRMIDAGLSESGQPYLVMEYVNGTHLDVHCNDQALGIRERLELFLQVCDAVAYAHRNLIVHLDLKPSNILVTQEGVAKLLDFGTSKLIQTDSLLTTTIMATPAYASPEQLCNEPVTTACDIYSLGAILFELLSGHRPGGKASVAIMIERAMREQEPERLESAADGAAADSLGLTFPRLRALLKGDLEQIVSKCLRARPKDRYSSVDVLTDDVRRYLAGRPVTARPQTTIYRMGKFVRRNRQGVAATVLASLLLASSLGYAEWRQQQALQAGQRAIRMQTFLYKLFKLANSHYTGKPAATVPEFLSLGVRILPNYISDPGDLREAQLALAESMYENGDQEGAQRTFTQVIASAKSSGDINSQVEAEAFSGNIDYLQGKNDEGAALTQDALTLSRKSGVKPPARVWSAVYYAWNRENSGFRSDENVHLLEGAVNEARKDQLPAHETADALYNLGQDYELRGDLNRSGNIFREALAIYGNDPSTLCDRSEIEGDLAYIIDQSGNAAGSLPVYKRAYDGSLRCSGPESQMTIEAREFYASALLKLGHAQEALAMLQADMPQWRKLEGGSADLAEPLNYLSLAELATGQFTDAQRDANEMLSVQTGKVAPTDRRFGATHMLLARALVGQNQYAAALPHARIADDLLNRNAVSVGAKKAGTDAHQELLDIQTHLSQK